MQMLYCSCFILVTFIAFIISSYNARWHGWAAITYGSLSVFFIAEYRNLIWHRDTFCPSFQNWRTVKSEAYKYRLSIPWEARLVCYNGSTILAVTAALAAFCAGGALYLAGVTGPKIMRTLLSKSHT